MTCISRINTKIFEFAYYAALDAAITRTTYGKTSGNKDLIKKDTKVRECVREYIEKILQETSDLPDFYKTADDLNSIIQNKDFTFGNIQKLINMTAKYYYIAVCSNSTLRGRFSACHCPMDRIMVEIVYKHYMALFGDKDEVLYFYTSKGTRSRDYTQISWSNIGFCKDVKKPNSIQIYKNFQKMVNKLRKKENLESALEYDIVHYNDFVNKKLGINS